MKTKLKTSVFLLPAKGLIGKLVAKPKGKIAYKCTANPPDGNRVFWNSISNIDKMLRNYVFLNSNGNSIAIEGNKPLRCRVDFEYLDRFRKIHNITEDVIITKMEGNVEVQQQFFKAIEELR